MTSRDYLDPAYPPALCDEAERADRLAHFAQSPAPASNLAPARNRWSGVVWTANTIIRTIFAVIGAIVVLVIGLIFFGRF